MEENGTNAVTEIFYKRVFGKDLLAHWGSHSKLVKKWKSEQIQTDLHPFPGA